MQTFKQFLDEGRGKAVSVDAFIAWVDENCSKYLKGSRHLYRGFQGGESGLLIGSSVAEKARKSVGGIPNNYTLWIDGHPKFKGFPKRSQAFIASTSIGKAGDFGQPHIMFVKDSDKVADVLTGDIWIKKVLPNTNLSDLNEITEMLLRRFDLGKNDKYFQLQNALQHVDLRLIRKVMDDKDNLANHYEYHLAFFIQKMEKEGWKDLWDLWNGLVTPDIFNLTTGGEIESDISSEVWVEGTCAFLSLESNRIESEEDRHKILAWLYVKNTSMYNVVQLHWPKKKKIDDNDHEPDF